MRIMNIISNLSKKVRIGNCIRCGNCCKILNWKEDLESDGTLQIIKLFGVNIQEILSLLESHNVCLKLDRNNTCKEYKTRIEVCRDYPKNEWDIERHHCKGYKFVENDITTDSNYNPLKLITNNYRTIRKVFRKDIIKIFEE